MNRAIATIILIFAMAPLGCGDAKPAGPAKGKANLAVTVVALPKTGAKPFKAYQTDQERAAHASHSSGELELVNYEHLDEVVVWLDSSGNPAASTAELRVAVNPKPAKAPLFAASVGANATIENNGAKPMSVYSVSEGNEFDLGTLAPGEAKSQRLASPGLIELLDGDTFDVVARVYVVSGRDARVTGSGEVITFRDLDPGTYRINAWHERLPGGERSITLAADVVREIDLPIGVNALPKVD
jgi:hypothetical protein